MSHRLAPVALLLLALASSSTGNAEPDPPAGTEDRPLDSSLVERAERRLIQLDISLFPKKKRGDAVVPQLSTDDLELVIDGSRIDIRYADRLCRVEETEQQTETRNTTKVAPIVPDVPLRTPAKIPTARGTYLFYFEHSHLTMEGQENALVMAEEMIPKMVRAGARGMVVSSGREVLRSDLTHDPDALLSFIRRVRQDPLQWGEIAYADGEWERYASVLDQQTIVSGNAPAPDNPYGGASLNDPHASGNMKTMLGHAQRRAQTYAREEYLRTNRQLRRFAAVLGSFAELDPPKAALYFADIIRKNAGQHYTELFAATDVSEDPFAPQMIAVNAAVAGLAFDRVTEQAAAHGVRLYTIRARGLEMGVSGLERSARARPNQMPMPDRGMRDADETMVAFAMETGGASFRGGTENSTINKVLNRIRSDLSCFYLLSFFPDRLRKDSLLPVHVRFNVDSPRHEELDRLWDLRSRGQLLVQSETKRKEAELLAAHTTSDSIASELGRSVLIPLGFSEDEYQVLAQFAVNAADLPAGLSPSTSWDLGMSLVFKDKVRHRVAKRLEVDIAGLPVVLETSWSFPPGPGEVVSVGYEHRFGQLSAVNVETDWPDPDGPAASITPIAVLQPASGLFFRVGLADDEQQRTAGPLAVGDGPVHLDLPIYFVGLVCRGKRSRDLWIDRKLVGNVAVDFGLQKWSDDDEERCVQVRDLIRPGQAGWGDFRYEVRVYGEQTLEGEPLAERVREFIGLEGGSG